MSMLLMVQALKAKVGNPLRKLVLVKLADQANDDGECWPSYQSIADACEMGRSTVKAHIAWLEEHGFLRVEYRHYGSGGKSKSNIYHLTIGKGSESVKSRPGQILTGSDTDLPRSDADPFNGSNPDPKPINKPIKESSPPSEGEAPAPATPSSQPEPEPDQPKPKRRTKADEFVAFVVARGVVEATARDWWQYRAGKPMTESAWQRHCTQAEAAGISVQEAAAFAAGKEWRAFYAEGFQREQSDLALARQVGQPLAPQGRTFDQTGREVSPAAGMPMAGGFGGATMPPQRTSKVAMGIAVLEEMKEKIRRGEI
ncbi:helix-turn-helix domain-containing protein [Cardiobacterium hominis]|uniref:helix-turn-helix domain-containing protein n=1 Tax=Cardiobacterium hominis TaxID=2718 RepID=UPI0028D37E58|nr:helix-turn-helix domain-containing protein [Cardiobacterium hominis]